VGAARLLARAAGSFALSGLADDTVDDALAAPVAASLAGGRPEALYAETKAAVAGRVEVVR
jgi:hypothetical protein